MNPLAKSPTSSSAHNWVIKRYKPLEKDPNYVLSITDRYCRPISMDGALWKLVCKILHTRKWSGVHPPNDMRSESLGHGHAPLQLRILHLLYCPRRYYCLWSRPSPLGPQWSTHWSTKQSPYGTSTVVLLRSHTGKLSSK